MYEYRVIWRRSGWSRYTGSKSRTFTRAVDLHAFLAKLRGDDRPDLAPLERLEVSRREVGRWTEWGA